MEFQVNLVNTKQKLDSTQIICDDTIAMGKAVYVCNYTIKHLMTWYGNEASVSAINLQY